MKKNQSSLTAQGIAVVRALETERPAGERVCYDPLARQFISPAMYHFMKFFVRTGYAEWRGPGTLGFLAARTRYLDDYLQSCLVDGIEQLVILGAGYDSRPYRFAALRGRVKVFEVDHPATQRVKLQKLRRIFGCVPAHVTYVPIDFSTETLDTVFTHGYDQALRTLFIWEGVVYYISTEAVDGTLAFVGRNARIGSSIIFDYTYTSVLDGTRKRNEPASMHRYERFTGESMHFGVPEGSIKAFLERRGFCDVVDVTGEELKRLYFTGVNVRRAVAPVYAIVHATVCPHGEEV